MGIKDYTLKVNASEELLAQIAAFLLVPARDIPLDDPDASDWERSERYFTRVSYTPGERFDELVRMHPDAVFQLRATDFDEDKVCEMTFYRGRLLLTKVNEEPIVNLSDLAAKSEREDVASGAQRSDRADIKDATGDPTPGNQASRADGESD